MATYHNVVKAQFYNSYFIENGPKVEKMHFFEGGKIIATCNSGWLGSGNNDGNNVIEAIEFTRKRKITLDAGFSFYVGDELYIWTGDCPDFEYLGERVAMQNDSDIYHGIYISFTCGGTAGQWEHIDEILKREFMLGPYSKCEKTEYGKKLVIAADLFTEAGVKTSSYEVEKMATNIEAIVSALVAVRDHS